MKTEAKELNNNQEDLLEAFMHAVIDNKPPEKYDFLLNHLMNGTTPKETSRDILLHLLKKKIGRQLLANIEEHIHNLEKAQKDEQAENEKK